MKNNVILLLVCLWTGSLFAQDEREAALDADNDTHRIYFSSGLYKSSYVEGDKPGMYIHAGYGFKLNENFWLNVDIIHSEARGGLEIYPLENSISNVTNWYFIPNFTKDFRIGEKSSISPKLGLFLNREYTSRLMYSMTQNDQNEIFMEHMRMSDEAIYTGGLFGL